MFPIHWILVLKWSYILKKLPALPNINSELEPHVHLSVHDKDEQPEKRFAFDFYDIICTDIEAPKSQTNLEKATSEVDRYLQYQVDGYILRSLEFTVLSCWKNHCQYFPILAKVIKGILWVQASSNASERVLSYDGNIVTKNRASLNSETVDKLQIILHANYKKYKN